MLLHRAGGQRHADRAALIWRVSGDDIWFFLISGVRSLDRGQRHRSEVDIEGMDGLALGLPMKLPVIYCNRQLKLDTTRAVERIGQAPDAFMRRIAQVWMREVSAQDIENRLSYRPMWASFLEAVCP